MRRRRTGLRIALLLVAGGLAAGCGNGDPARDDDADTRRYEHDFATGVGTWIGDTADYGVDTAPLDARIEARPLPAPFTGVGLYMGGTNRSDDLFVYARTAVSDLVPGQPYRVAIDVEFLTDAPRDCVGVGGAPGESVWLVAGAAAHEPVTRFDGTDYRVDIDRGNQATGGRDAVVLGDVAGTNPDCLERSFEQKRLATAVPSPLRVRADARGTVWLLVGLDSGYESRSAIYLRRVSATLTPELAQAGTGGGER